MEGIDGDDQGIFHTLDLDVHIGGHARQHTVGLLQGHLGAVLGDAGGGVGYLADFGDGAGEYLAVGNGGDGDFRCLVLFQSQNVGFVNGDGDGHDLIGVQVHQLGDGGGGSGFLVIEDRADAAVHGTEHSAVPVDGQQLHQILLQVGAAAQEGVIIGAELGVFQLENGGVGVHLGIFLHRNRADGTGVAHDRQGIVDVQLAGSQNCAAQGNGDFLVHSGAVVGNQNGGPVSSCGFHGAQDGIVVTPGNGDLLALGQPVGFDVYRQIAVQGHNGQGAVFCHAQGNIHVLLAENLLDAAGNTGADVAAGFVALGLGDLIVQILQLILDIGQGSHNGGQVHGGDEVAGRHGITGFGNQLRYLHTGRHIDGFHILFRENAAAVHNGMDGAGGNGVFLNLCGGGSEALFHILAQQDHRGHQCQGNDQKDDGDGTDNFSSLLFLFLAELVKQGIGTLILIVHGRMLLMGKITLLL